MSCSRLKALFAAAAAFAAFAGEAAADGNVVIDTATSSGTSATVTGTAVFEPVTGPQSVVGPDAVFGAGQVAATPVGDAAGLALTDATIEPLANGAGLRFTWHVASMPEQVPPEGVRYAWSFSIDGASYVLQAKRTNLASTGTAENPVGHVRRAASQEGFFELRGSCVIGWSGAPLIYCYHLAFLSGRFDAAAKTISIDLPFETKDDIGRIVAPEFKPGVEIRGITSVENSVISASFQAVRNNSDATRWIGLIDSYFTAPRVELAVGTAESGPTSVNFLTRAALDDGGRFIGTVGPLTPQRRTVFVRACNGARCAYAQHTL